MTRILAGEEAEESEDRRKRAEAGDPQRRNVGHALHHDLADDHPGQKRADAQEHAGGQRHEVAAHARTEDADHCASLNSSYHAIWIASSFGSLDAFGSSLKPSRTTTFSRRSLSRIVGGSTPGNFSACAMP